MEGGRRIVGLFQRRGLQTSVVVDTETWAALFIVLALVSRSLTSYWPSLAFGLLACLVRELAMPLLIVMLVFAWLEGKRKEAIAWMGATVVFLLVYGIHIGLAQSATSAGGPESQGWLVFGGVPFVIETIRQTTALLVVPAWVTAVVVPLAVLGWPSRKSSLADRVVALFAIYFAVFMVIGRMQNTYWGTLYVPLIGAGLAFSVSGLAVLARVIMRPPKLSPVDSTKSS